MSETPNVRELGIRSRAAVTAGDRDGWLGLFADGRRRAGSHRPVALRSARARVIVGIEAIAKFYDTVIASSEAIEFEITDSYLCGDEVADVGIIRTTLAGGTHQAVVHGVYTYRSDGAGKIAALRAFWEFDALEMVELGQ